MPTPTSEYRDEDERPAPERGIASITDLRQPDVEAPAGTVLDACEGLALDKGRDLLRTTLAAAPGGRIALAGQKGGTPAPAPRRTPDAPRARTRGPS